MTKLTNRQARAAEGMRHVLATFAGAVKAGGKYGAKADTMFCAVSGYVTREQFDDVMAALVKAGKVEKRTDTYYWQSHAV